MTITLWLFGVQVLAFTIGPTAAGEDGNSLDGGSTSAYPVGFTPWPTPDEATILRPVSPWEDDSEAARG